MNSNNDLISGEGNKGLTNEEITISFKNTGDISSGKYVAVIVV